MARAPPTLPQPTNEIGLCRHSTNVQSMAFLSTAGIPVVVLGGENDEAVGPVDGTTQTGHLLREVVTWVAGGSGSLEERERVVAQIEQLDVEPLTGLEAVDGPFGDTLAEAAFPRGAGDHLEEHQASAGLGRGPC